jgi:hypothetical protein
VKILPYMDRIVTRDANVRAVETLRDLDPTKPVRAK